MSLSSLFRSQLLCWLDCPHQLGYTWAGERVWWQEPQQPWWHTHPLGSQQAGRQESAQCQLSWKVLAGTLVLPSALFTELLQHQGRRNKPEAFTQLPLGAKRVNRLMFSKRFKAIRWNSLNKYNSLMDSQLQGRCHATDYLTKLFKEGDCEDHVLCISCEKFPLKFVSVIWMREFR